MTGGAGLQHRPTDRCGRPELGIYDSTLGNWVRQDRIDRGEAEGLTTEERAPAVAAGAGLRWVAWWMESGAGLRRADWQL